MKHQKLKVGDVFSVPIDGDRIGLGQAVARFFDAHYLAVYDLILPADKEIDLIATLRGAAVLFLGLSSDAKIYVGDWRILGHLPVPDSVVLPAYKLCAGLDVVVTKVVDYSGTRERIATADEASILSNRTMVSPVRFEKALKARCGLVMWEEHFADLYPRPEATTARMFPSTPESVHEA